MRRRFRGSSLFWDVEIAGEVTADGGLQSPNYVAGTSGWRIDGDGNVEFNDGTFRGDLGAGRIVGDLILVGGKIATGDAGERIEIGTFGASMNFFTGHADEVAEGYVNVGADTDGDGDFGFISLVAPDFGVDPVRAYIDVRHYDTGLRKINVFADGVALAADLAVGGDTALGLTCLPYQVVDFTGGTLDGSGVATFAHGISALNLRVVSIDYLYRSGGGGQAQTDPNVSVQIDGTNVYVTGGVALADFRIRIGYAKSSLTW